MHLTTAELTAGIDRVREAPARSGTVELVVRRPAEGQREVLDVATLDPELGLVGDNWLARGSTRTHDGTAHPEMQLNVMSARAIALIAGSPDRWALAGDQLYVDLALDDMNLPTGTRLALGTAVIEVTEVPHNGCAKFAERFGRDAARFVNSPVGKELHLRGINAKVVQAGTVRRGDTISCLPPDS
ncbi:MAG: MOSC domain-containing protein [Acidimicrobiales bacterium]